MRHPIVLVHGIARFDKVWNDVFRVDNHPCPLIDNVHYFKGIRTTLERHGFPAYHAKTPWASALAVRAEHLRRAVLRVLRRTSADKVHLIAHSMGGLDARRMMFDDRRRGRIHHHIASLSTISTPHAGSPVAEWELRRPGIQSRLAAFLDIDTSGVRDLTRAACRAYNEDANVIAFEARCANQIDFRTYAGRREGWGLPLFSMYDTYRYLKRTAGEGDNDGMVSVRSAMWRQEYFRDVWENTDHLNEIGWWAPDHLPYGESPWALERRVRGLYLDMARELE